MIDALNDERKFEVILTLSNGNQHYVPVKGAEKAISLYEDLKDLVQRGHEMQRDWWEDTDSGLLVKVQDISTVQVIEVF